jgi:cation diffusion facilitator CzcD-associated flavoprotein CzcO
MNTNTNRGLADLESQVRRDLRYVNYPPADWVPQTLGPNALPLLDVLIVGAGMCGQTAAFALLREGVRKLRVIDRASPGREGPWGTFARMPTLRSPKQLTGPDLGLPSLTFRAWYEAQHGVAGWEALGKIGRLEWLDYLLWVRRVLGLPVENDTELASFAPHGALLCAQLRKAGKIETVFARKVVLALGRDGSGAQRWPLFPGFDPAAPAARGRVFHSADDIDFAAFAGKRVAVLGAGASAFDNAGTALEAGAAPVTLFARRTILPQINKSKWASFPGFSHGYLALDDAARWKFFTTIFSAQVPPPHESVLRCDRHSGFAIRFGAPWLNLLPDAYGVTVRTPQGDERYDAAIVATGFDVDLMARAELAALRAGVLTWADRVAPEEADRHPEEARFPYLGEGFEFCERVPGTAPALRNVHVFNWGATMSHGALAGDIPGLGTGAARLAQGIARSLFVIDRERHFESMLAFDEHELKPTRYYVPGGS